MIHIVFNEADVAVLQAAIALDETLAGDIIQIKDDYAVGPLADIYTGTGREDRRLWWKEVLEGGDYEGIADDGHVNDLETIAGVVGTMRRDETLDVWIWAAQN